MSSDELSDDPALDSDASNGEDLMDYANQDGAIASLAAAGLYTSPVGIAAGMAIASGSKKRKKNHTFETDPSIRKRQQTRLINRLKATIDEFTTRVGQQAIVLVVTPQKQSQKNFKVFGAKPLENVIRSCKQVIMNEFENLLAQSAPPPSKGDSTKHELPPLVVDGIPTPVEKMTQAQLRAFIPLMLKYSTGRGKPGWGKDSTKPPWWPEGLPWANVRSDARSEDEKGKFSWTHALRQIVSNCYEYHGRQDLLPSCSEYDDKTRINSSNSSGINNNNVNSNSNSLGHQNSSKDDKLMYAQSLHQYAPTVVQTIQNPDGTISLANADGTLSLVQIDPNMHVITMPDGTQAQAVLILDTPPEQQQM